MEMQKCQAGHNHPAGKFTRKKQGGSFAKPGFLGWIPMRNSVTKRVRLKKPSFGTGSQALQY
jgi:hypothetical protein